MRFAGWLVMVLVTACDGGSTLDAGVDAGAGDASGPPPTVETEHGPVVGLRDDGVAAFLGIPFAAPPVGALRWQPPQPPEPWTEPLDATSRPARCTQNALGLSLASSEDCLYLNVHTPDPMPSGAPVMVWLHGGAFLFGEGLQTDDGTAGDRLARAHGVVVVSMNYRLGPFGFFAHEGLTSEQGASGNYGLMDQRAALEWVRDNIAAFGGNPDDVTLFGESAGGLSVCAHMISEASEGLFHRAISQSGLCDSALASLADAEAIGARFAETVGCDTEADVIACMRGKTAEEISDADTGDADVIAMLQRERAWWPIVDGDVLTGDFRARVTAGEVADVPTIVGWNADEGTLFVLLAEQSGAVVDEAVYESTLNGLAESAGVDPADVLAQYPLADYDDPGAATAAALGHSALACPSRRAALLLAEHGQDLRVYHFTYPDAAFQLPSGRALGAFHSAEIQYVFGHPASVGRRNFVGDDVALHEAITGYWGRFANGDPNGDGALAWPAFDVATETHLVLDRTIATGTAADAADCALWDAAR